MNLDINQETAAKYISGHSLIIAGAGSGKTTTLLKKVEYLIKNGIKEDEILVLSFTNEAVINFTKKCKYNIKIQTFHKAALGFLEKEYYIIEDYIIDNVIESFLNKIDRKLQKKLFYIFNSIFSIYTMKNFEILKKDKSANGISKTIRSCISIIKSNNIDINKLKADNFTKKEKLILYCVQIILKEYNDVLKNNDLIDFDNMILKATYNLNHLVTTHKYKHILVDEYQDISKIRLDFLNALVKNNTLLTAVGDDWQSIYRFNGSNITLFREFNNYFKNSKIFILKTTYRCPQQIINKSSKFIMKNKNQIKKEIISINNTHKKCIKKIYSDNEKKDLYNIIKSINKNESFFILSRNNFDINKYKSKKLNIINDKIFVNNKLFENGRFITMHSSKGLEADIIIIINLKEGKSGFPDLKYNELINKLINIKEPIKYAEERRLFYVALTRAKKKVYLIVDKNHPSRFVKEV